MNKVSAMCVTLMNKGLINPADNEYSGACRCEINIDEGAIILEFTHKRKDGLARGLREAAHALDLHQIPDHKVEPCLKGF